MVKDGDTVRVNYIGTLEDGSIFDTSAGHEPLEFTLGEGKIIPGFEEAVKGMEIGQSKTVTIPAKEAYGQHRDDLVVEIKREELPEGLNPEIKQQLQMRQTDGRAIVAIVTDVSESTITVDANHPLTGKDLTFQIELVEIK
jgi:peptidylprolyl isomerase